MDGEIPPSLFERNVKAFEAHAPSLWRRLRGLDPLTAALMPGPLDPDNIDLGGKTLYDAGARTDTRTQLDTYFDEPDRLRFASLAHCNLSEVSIPLVKEMQSFAAEEVDRALLRDAPVVDIGYTFVFGLGLGLHLKELLERTACKHLVVLEPMPVFYLHSMHAVDWSELWQTAEDNGQAVHVFVGPEPETLMRAVYGFLDRVGRTFLDGSYAYHHYYSWQIKRTRELFNERMRTYHWTMGFFEDELLMVGNTARNFAARPFHIIERRAHLSQEAPVCLVGSGPSLDRDLPVLQSLSDRALVVSCGSALGILLKNGIRPDFHVETENTFPLVNNLKKWTAEYGFDGITLLASCSVHPEAAGLFDDVWYFFRPGLSCSRLLNGGHHPLTAASPLVANAGFDAVTTIGLRHAYMFGVDCGRRPEGAHHARDAVYLESDYDNFLPGVDADSLERQFDRVVAGNFGGEIETSWKLEFSRNMFGRAARLKDLRLFNCSDGAAIPGAKPLASRAIRLAPLDLAKADIVASIGRQLPAYPAGGIVSSASLADFRTAAERFIDLLTPEVAAAREEDAGFWEINTRFQRFVREQAPPLSGFLELAHSTFFSAVRVGSYLGNRIDDAEQRARFREHFFDQFLEMNARIGADAVALYAELIAELESGR